MTEILWEIAVLDYWDSNTWDVTDILRPQNQVEICPVRENSPYAGTVIDESLVKEKTFVQLRCECRVLDPVDLTH